MSEPATIHEIQVRMQTARVGDIYSAIGNQLPEHDRNAVIKAAALRIPSPLEIGKAFYERTLRPAMIAAICGKAKYCANRTIYESAASLTGMVADNAVEAVAKIHGWPPESGKAAKMAVEVSAAILKEGLNDLCDCSAE